MLRPPVPPELHTGSVDLVLQLFEVDVQNSAAPTFDVSNGELLRKDAVYQPSEENRGRSFNKAGPSIVYVFGVTQEGHSVCVAVRGFQPFFYVELKGEVDTLLVQRLRKDFERALRLTPGTVGLDIMLRKRAYGWVPESVTEVQRVRQFEFAKLSFPTVAAMREAATLLEGHALSLKPSFRMNTKDRERVAKLGTKHSVLRCLATVTTPLDVCELKTQPSEKFLAQRGLTASGWMRVPARAYEVVDPESRCTYCQLEVACDMGALLPLSLDRVAPIVIAAVDIEVQSGDFRSFPDANNDSDPCTYIGTTFWVYGDRAPRLRVMQVLGTCAPVEGMVVESYQTEYELLTAWRDLIVLRGDPDKIISYNGTGFDFAYMYRRYERVRRQANGYSRFCHLGRYLFESQSLKVSKLESAAMGQNENSLFPMSGRWQMDLFHYVKINHKLSSYKLDDVCAHFLKGKGGSVGPVEKVVLEFPNWVEDLTRRAVQYIKAQAAEHAPPDVQAKVNASCDEALRLCNSCAVEGGLFFSSVDETEQVLKDGEDDEPDDGDARWLPVHRALEKALDFLGDSLTSATATVREDVRDVLDREVQPALDASGTDNYRKLFRMYVEGAAHRAAIARYCQVDCDLLLYLMDRISVVPNTVQMSQVCNTLLNDIANRGQQIKTFNLISRFAYNNGYVLNFRNVGWDPTAEYEGATVLPPRPAYYQTPVATLDFASLYPSIMQAYNLCFSSIVLDDEYKCLESAGAQYGKYDIAGKTWVFQEHTKGVLPQILAELVAARRRVKKEMAKFDKSSLDYKLADGKQLALKVSCNSVYGFCGVLNNGMFPCMPVAVATTFNGRQLIQQTKAYVETHFGCTVVYGDTDSVMIQFPNITTVAEAFPLAARAAAEVSATMRDVVKLEFEKVYMPYLLIKKKHYAGMKYEGEPDDPPVLDAKGLAVVRRDNCALVRTTMRDVLHLCMRDGNPMAAYEVVQRAVNRLVNREVDMAELEVSNFLRKDLKDDHHPHIQVVKNMEARHAFGIPRVGDRVPYVILEGRKDSKIYERAEHPKYVQEQGLRVDLEYYLRNQMQKRLDKVLKPLPIPDVDAMFDRAVAEANRKRMGMRKLDSYFGGGACAAPVSAPVPVKKQKGEAAASTRQTTLFAFMTKKNVES